MVIFFTDVPATQSQSCIISMYVQAELISNMKDTRESQLHIRQAHSNDLDSVYHFVNELENTQFDFEPFKEAFEQNINNPDCVYIIAELDSKPVGYISCHTQLLLHHGGDKIAEIQELYVLPESRNLGIGRSLVEKLKCVLRLRGIRQIEVTSNNKRIDTHRFYEREGFIQSHKKFTCVLG